MLQHAKISCRKFSANNSIIDTSFETMHVWLSEQNTNIDQTLDAPNSCNMHKSKNLLLAKSTAAIASATATPIATATAPTIEVGTLQRNQRKCHFLFNQNAIHGTRKASTGNAT